MQKLSQIFSYSLDSGAGTQTINQSLDPMDFSGYSALVLRCSAVKTDTDAADTCVIRLQTSADPATPVWDDRICLESFTGDQSASATAPETKQGTVWNTESLDSVEAEFEESGSAGGTSLSAGAVKNGPYFNSLYNPLTNSRQPSCRLNIVVTDADADADFEIGIKVYGLSRL